MVLGLFSRTADDDRVDEDVEADAQAAFPNDADVFRKLESLESKLGTLLTSHIQEIKALRGDKDRKARMSETSGADTITEEAHSHVHTHLKHLDDFFDGYVQNVRVLQARLDSKFPQGQETTNEHVHIEEKTYAILSQQFNMQLLISTFTASLTVSFVGLSKSLQIEGAYTQRLFNVGALLSLFALAMHIFNILISGRAAALCSNHTLVKEHTLAYFHRALATCEQLYLHGTLVFGVAMLELSFVMFNSIIYPAVFCGVTALAGIALLTGKFRKVSVLYKNAVRVKALVWTLGGRARRSRKT
ncbi:hypothetical protein APHAL10511_000467 [Amanita phalloides]|nr:hypothetical protein APHAL10511_000467 [Amanita phalloides]